MKEYKCIISIVMGFGLIAQVLGNQVVCDMANENGAEMIFPSHAAILKVVF